VLNRPTVDVLDPQFHGGDPHPAHTRMRANEPVFRDVNGIWCVTSMDDVRDIERRPDDLTSDRGDRSTWFPDETSMIPQDDRRFASLRRLGTPRDEPKLGRSRAPARRAPPRC
jgi:cytochrome P450